ncbi:hypothetical protein [Mesobacillus jeotgali]|uniref:hypothetical protein n=1 Tax=Mesobacillus jeotgali TaxID=129985 RepID=UPI0009A790F5|nr:hypothetical protein [Mesobacillus jeotgali]
MWLKKSFLVSLVVLLFVSMSTPQSQVNAEVTSDDPLAQLEDSVKFQLEKLVEVTDKKEKSRWVKRAEKQIQKGQVKIYSTELDFENAKVFTYKENDFHSVTIPVSSEKHHEISNVALHFLKPGKVESYSEILIQKSEIDTFQTIAYINGEVTFNEVTDEMFYTAAEYFDSQDGAISTMGFSFSGFVKCLGLPSIVGWQLGNICAIACLTGVLCLPCLAVALGMSTGAIATCFYLNW